jgi:Heterokaryon incompatibility protein (HET)
MRLINTTSFKLELFVPPDVPEYAILSHTWGKDEVTFQDFQYLQHARTKDGFSKIEMTCELARANGIDYAWVDTCCIDKSSSSELSESINSMYLWYQQAKICYAYINDWPLELTWADLGSIIPVNEKEVYDPEEHDSKGGKLEGTKSEEHEPEEHISQKYRSNKPDSEDEECKETRSEGFTLEDIGPQVPWSTGTRSQECKEHTLGEDKFQEVS